MLLQNFCFIQTIVQLKSSRRSNVDLPFDTRLEMKTLKVRRERDDLIEQPMIDHGLEEVDFLVPRIPAHRARDYNLGGHNQRLERQLVKDCDDLLEQSSRQLEFAAAGSRRSVRERASQFS